MKIKSHSRTRNSGVTETEASFPDNPFLFAALLLLATLLAYLPAAHGGFIWDDDTFITDNPLLQTLTGLRKIWFDVGATSQYYPLTYTSFWIEYHLWGFQPAGYHVVNILLHALNAILVWRVLRYLNVPGAWLAASIFALHPVEVESVAWISERKNVLSGMCYLLAALCYFRFQPLDGPEKTSARDWRFYPLVLLLFICALGSKTVACSLPAALLLVRWWRQGRLRWNDTAPLLPLFIIGAGLGLLTAGMEKYRVGARGADWSLTGGQRLLVAGRALWFYAGKLAWPSHLIFVYPHWDVNTGEGWQWLFPAAALGAVAALWLARRKIGRGPLAAVLFFAGTLFPALGFIDVYPFRYSYVADHFQYLASLGLITLAAAGIARLSRWRPGLPIRASVLGMLAALAILTGRQCETYANIETLWRTTLAQNPDAALAHYNLALLLARTGRYNDALAQINATLELQPDAADAHNNAANLLMKMGRPTEALAHYHKALEIDPDYLEALNNLAWTLSTCADPSIRDGAKAVALAKRADWLATGQNPMIIRTLAAAYAEAGQFPDAIAAIARAQQLTNPQTNPQMWSSLQDQLKHYQASFPYRDAGSP